MKAFDKIRDFFAPEEDDSYDTEPVRETREVRERREIRESILRDDDDSIGSAREIREPSSLRESYKSSGSSYPSKRDNKVVNIQATAQLQVLLFKTSLLVKPPLANKLLEPRAPTNMISMRPIEP